MTIILDNYTIPQKGHIEMLVSFDLNVTAEEARRQVDRWLHQQVTLRSVD